MEISANLEEAEYKVLCARGGQKTPCELWLENSGSVRFRDFFHKNKQWRTIPEEKTQ
jgi:hypothetical protein